MKTRTKIGVIAALTLASAYAVFADCGCVENYCVLESIVDVRSCQWAIAKKQGDWKRVCADGPGSAAEVSCATRPCQ